MADAEYVVRIPEELNKRVNMYCELLGLKPEELISHAVGRFYGLPPYSKEKFFKGKGRKYFIPRSCFIIFALPYEEHRKLAKWLMKGDKIDIATAPDNEVIIMNQTKLSKWKAKKEKQN